MTKTELANMIEAFVSGTCGEWDWDDFVSVSHEDPEIEAIRQQCLRLDRLYPPRKPHEFCNDEGAAVLMEYVRELRVGKSESGR